MPESRNNYKKTDIKLELINKLRAQSMTQSAIQDFLSAEYKRLGKVPLTCTNPNEYKVHIKTVKRVLDSIYDLYGDQLDFDPEFGTYKLDLRDFPDTIEDTEIQALDIAIQKLSNNINARKLLEGLKAKLTTRLYRKIEHMEPASAERKINDIDKKINSDYAFVGPRLITGFDDKVKSVLDSAISKQHEIHFQYYNKETSVCPLGIMYGPNNVYLIGYECKDAKICDKPRHYILSAISNVTETKKWFPRTDGFTVKDYANSMFGVYNDGAIYDIEWLIKDKKTIKIAKQYLFHPTQHFQDNPKDGSLTVTMHTGGLYAISTFLTQWDGKIIPIKPKALIDKYEELLKNCLASIGK